MNKKIIWILVAIFIIIAGGLVVLSGSGGLFEGSTRRNPNFTDNISPSFTESTSVSFTENADTSFGAQDIPAVDNISAAGADEVKFVDTSEVVDLAVKNVTFENKVESSDVSVVVYFNNSFSGESKKKFEWFDWKVYAGDTSVLSKSSDSAITKDFFVLLQGVLCTNNAVVEPYNVSIEVHLDPDAKIVESNELNNIYPSTFTCPKKTVVNTGPHKKKKKKK